MSPGESTTEQIADDEIDEHVGDNADEYSSVGAPETIMEEQIEELDDEASDKM